MRSTGRWFAVLPVLTLMMACAGCDLIWKDKDKGPDIDDTPPTLQEIFDWADGSHESMNCTVRDDQGNHDSSWFCTGQFLGVADSHCIPLVVDGAARTLALQGSDVFFSLPELGEDLVYFFANSTTSGSVVSTTFCHEEGDLAVSAFSTKPALFTLEVGYGTCDTGDGDLEYTAGGGGGIYCIMYSGSSECTTYCN